MYKICLVLYFYTKEQLNSPKNILMMLIEN